MQMDTIVYCNMIGFVMLAMLLISSHEFANKNKIENKMFFKTVYIIMGACLAEMIGFFLDGMMFAGSRFIYMFLRLFRGDGGLKIPSTPVFIRLSDI